MAKENKQLHVALFPWLAFGHLNPFLHLAVALADAGLRISYISTPRNIRRLPANTIPPHLSSNINFIQLSMPSVEGLPENAEATVDLTSFDQNSLLHAAYDQLEDQVKKFLAGDDAPDYFIYDINSHWAPKAALEAGGVPSMVFSILSSSTMAFNGWPGDDIDENEFRQCCPDRLVSLPDWITFPTKIRYRRWEANMLCQIIAASDIGIWYYRSIKGSDAVAVRCCNEFNAEFLELLPKLLGKQVIPVGWLPPTFHPMDQDTTERVTDENWMKSAEWLDKQPPKSVVLVSFGSEHKMNKDAVMEVAHGLELSNLPFLWVLRRQDWLGSDENDEKALPDGFLTRTQGRGLVSFGWAPVLKILAHKSTGGVLFHGGLSTAVEALSYGLVLVMLAGFLDHGLITQRLVEKGLGVEIEREESDGSFDRHAVAKALRMAMVGEESKNLREKASEMSAILGDHAVQNKYIEQLVDFLVKSSRKRA